MMNNIQPAILDDALPFGRFLILSIRENSSAEQIKNNLLSIKMDENIIVGFGKNLLNTLAIYIDDFRDFPDLNTRVNIPATHGDLFVFVRDLEPGKVAHRALTIMNKIKESFDIKLLVNGFRYLAQPDKNGHDLTGYEDGTENPTGEDMVSAVVRADGSCFVIVQQWLHDLTKFAGFSQEVQDNTIGRRLSDNQELSTAPSSSHVNRSDQGTFNINADILRRSMPFSNEHGDGLMFMAYCESLDRFEVQLRRMSGLTDGIIDALFTFSKPINGAYFYCPPINKDRLILNNKSA